MRRTVGAAALLVLVMAGQSVAVGWKLLDTLLVDEDGSGPSLWKPEVAYQRAAVGDEAVMLYNGSSSSVIHDPKPGRCWEVTNANGSVAWRQQDGSVNDIHRWTGGTSVNLTNTPDDIECDLTGGSNGDLMWSFNHRWLMYYDADLSGGTVISLNVKGIHPALYIATDGTSTYAYEDPDTHEVRYFDGTTTHICGAGLPNEAHPSVFDGAVAWVGEGAGGEFTRGEIFFWKYGILQRVTNDDAGPAVADHHPSVWADMVTWDRGGPWTPRLWFWDGQQMTELATLNGKYPSYHDGTVAWCSEKEVRISDLLYIMPADCNEDGSLDQTDLVGFVTCLSGPAEPMPGECGCYDIHEDGHVDLADFADLQIWYTAD